MAKVTVAVTGDPSNPTLSLDRPNVDLIPGEILRWEFLNVPSDCVPSILFDLPLGPFEALQVSNESVIEGGGNLGDAMSYNYKARLLDKEGIRGQFLSGVVQNLVTAADTSPSVVATCTLRTDSTPEEPIIDIDLDNSILGLFEGDMAFWQVSGLGEGFFVTFRFKLPGADSILGPFEDLVFVRALEGESPDVVRLIGVRFTPPDPLQKIYPYRIEVRDSTGKLRGSKDPQIDNLGPPPQG